MARRSHGLSLRARRLLIMVDGSRDCASLVAMLKDCSATEALEMLLENGFIAPLVVASPDEGDAPVIDDAKRYEMARNFMLNTVSAFLGVFGSALSDKLEAAGSLEELRVLYQDWREAIRLTPDGRKRAEELDNRLAALLS